MGFPPVYQTRSDVCAEVDMAKLQDEKSQVDPATSHFLNLHGVDRLQTNRGERYVGLLKAHEPILPKNARQICQRWRSPQRMPTVKLTAAR